MKPQIRVIGFDDEPHERHKKGKQRKCKAFPSFENCKFSTVKVIRTFFRGGDFIDGVLKAEVMVDGSDSTEKLIKTINKSKFKPQLQAIFLDGIAFGGFNIIDIEKLYKKTKIPVIVIIRKKPDIENIKNILKKIGMKEKIKLIEKAGKPIKLGKIYIQFKGIKIEELKELLKICCKNSFLPECIRTAHLIAQGIYFGESKGDA